jgi:hypothetical protein
MKPGYGSGTSFSGPISETYKPPGVTQEVFSFIPGSAIWNDRDYDFTQGEASFYELQVPLLDATNDAHTILVGANSRARVKIPRAGRLISAHLIAEDALALDTTNHLTFTVTNELASGSGSVEMLSTTTGANTTDTDNASAVAITAKTGRAFTVSAVAGATRVAEGDHLLITATVGGTLANAVDLPIFILRFATLPPGLKPTISRIAGSPLLGPVDDSADGEAVMTLSSTNEAQICRLDWDDQLLIPATKAFYFSCRLKVSGVAANTRMVWGLTSAFNSTLDTTTNNAWFRLEGNSLALLIETDDDTTNRDDQTPTNAFTLTADTYYTFEIDGEDTANIRFRLNGSELGKLSASALTAAMVLQPIVAIQKDSGTGTQSITVDRVRVRWLRSYTAAGG